MGCGASVPVDDDEIDLFLQDKRINDAIEQSLQLRQQNSKRGVKLLLLGAGESGKSTVLKQLKLLGWVYPTGEKTIFSCHLV